MIQGKKTTYRDSGVNIEASDLLVKNIKALVGPDPRGRARAGIGGFAALYEMDDERLLASATDGVGTKLKWAFLTGEHRAVGLDLVAMSVNDILCVGATPLFFLDYLATGKLEVAVAEHILRGVVEGCRQSKAFLIGGETAEMPGMYRPREYDLAGFAVGEVSRKDVVDGSRLKEGDTMVGLASSGLHANGFSLARRLIAETEMDIIREAMAPTVIYTSVVGDILSRGLATGLAHITGGGWHNITRVSSRMDYLVEATPSLEEIPPIFSLLAQRSRLSREELYATFNMGVGFVVLTPRPTEVQGVAKGLNLDSWVLGQVRRGKGRLLFQF